MMIFQPFSHRKIWKYTIETAMSKWMAIRFQEARESSQMVRESVQYGCLTYDPLPPSEIYKGLVSPYY